MIVATIPGVSRSVWLRRFRGRKLLRMYRDFEAVKRSLASIGGSNLLPFTFRLSYLDPKVGNSKFMCLE